jgi:hypothetical protein
MTLIFAAVKTSRRKKIRETKLFYSLNDMHFNNMITRSGKM